MSSPCFYRVISTSESVGELEKTGNTCLWLVFPQHFLFSQTSTYVFYNSQKYSTCFLFPKYKRRTPFPRDISCICVGFRGKELPLEKGEGRGRKETLADKPLDFENRLLCLSCLTDFMPSSSIQVVFVILVLTRFEILDHCIFLSNKNHTRLPQMPEVFFLYFRDEAAIVSGKATH